MRRWRAGLFCTVLCWVCVLPPAAQATPTAAPTVSWTTQFGSVNYDLALSATATSSDVYVAGETSGTLPGQFSAGNNDAFVRRYSAIGSIVWTRQFGTSGYEAGNGVAVAGTAVYVVGTISGGTFPEQPSAGGVSDVFLRKYSANGAVLWTRQFGTDSSDYGYDVVAGPDAVFVVGRAAGTLPGQESVGSSDAFVRRYAPNGDVVWTHQFGTSGTDEAYGVGRVGSALFVGGHVGGTFPGQTSAGGQDSFVRRYDLDGNIAWTRQFGTASTDQLEAFAAGPSGVFVGGYTGGAMTAAPFAGALDAFIRRYSLQGTKGWTAQLGSPEIDQVHQIAVAGPNVYLAGTSGAALPGHTSQGQDDAFLQRRTSSGAVVWSRQVGTGDNDDGHGVAASTAGVFLAGGTYSTFPGQTSSGGWDVLTRRYVSNRPDALLSLASSSGFVGNDVYNLTGTKQTRSVSVARGAKRTVFVRAANDGDAASVLGVTGCAATSKFGVHYFRGTNDITSKVVAGTYRTPKLNPGAGVVLRAVFAFADDTPVGATRTCGVSLKAAGGTPADVVKAVVKATS